MTWDAILCADWSKDVSRREVYVAKVLERTIQRLGPARWDFAKLAAAAQASRGYRSVLVGIDVPLGIPRSLAAASIQIAGSSIQTFLGWLREACRGLAFFSTCASPATWSPGQPFFAVGRGKGERNRWFDALRASSVDPYRSIDRRTGAKPVFIVSGLPGTVGSSAREVWRELMAFGTESAVALGIWPFDGDLATLATSGIVVGEIYPRALYGVALGLAPPDQRHRLTIAKTQAAARAAALDSLVEQPWIRQCAVEVRDLDSAHQSEDAFDALVSAAALLRCVCEGTPLAGETDPFEGGMLGAASLDLSLPERTFAPSLAVARVPRVTQQATFSRPQFRCPLPDCPTVFYGTRGGWDSHVGSLARHPRWHPDLSNPRQRKELFRREFPEFFPPRVRR
jgi:hypothetical protein